VNNLLLLLNIAVFVLEGTAGDWLIAHFALWPLGRHAVSDLPGTVGFLPWQLVTSAFLHASLAHLATNMFALWMFGRDVERELGARRYLGLYAAAVLSASLLQLAIVSSAWGEAYPTLGASGGVFGVLLAYGMLFPRRTVLLLIPPIPMPARVFVILYGVLELVQGVVGTQSGVAHFAHLGGMLGAWLVLRRWRARPDGYA
jgi:membrane associated rhomboid family serine protease